MNIQTPPKWRKGQTIFNFLEWLLLNGHAPANQAGSRAADTFHLPDDEFDALFEEFLAEQGVEATKAHCPYTCHCLIRRKNCAYCPHGEDRLESEEVLNFLKEHGIE